MGTRALPFPEQPKDPVVQRRIANLEKRSLTRPQIDQQPVYQQPTGGGSRSHSVVVAAYDSADPDKADADFVTDGSAADLATIMDAIAYGSSSWGGSMRMCSGSYFTEDSIIVPEAFNIEGDGYTTWIYTVGGHTTPIFNLDPDPFGARIANLGMDGFGDAQDAIYADAASADLVLEGLQIYGCTRHGINLAQTGSFDHNDFRIRNNFINSDQAAVYIEQANRGWIVDNRMEPGQYGVHLQYGAQATIIRGNIITNPDQYGILIDNAYVVKVEGNELYGFLSTAGIALINDASNNRIIGNVCDNFPVGIQIGALANDNFVTVNDLRGSTTAITDAGAGNIKIHNPGDDI